MKTLRAVVKKEAKEIIRDRITLGTAIYLPVVMLFLFGYAMSFDVNDVRMAVYDMDRSPQSARLIEAFNSTGYFRINYDLSSFDQANDVLDRGKASIVLVVPQGFSDDLAAGRKTRIPILLDGTFSSRALIVSNYAQALVSQYAADIVSKHLERLGTAASPLIEIRSRVWYNASMKSVNYIVPGLFAVLLMAIPPLLTGLAIVKEKETGTIAQVFVSPITPLTFIAGKIIPYSLIAFAEMLLILVTGTLWFGIPFKGSLPLLLATSLIYVMCTVSIGLFVSTIARTQLAAVLLSFIVTFMPSFLFSGFLFPIMAMPYVLQLYTYIFPARYFNDISRDIFLKGVGIDYLWWNILLLVVYTLILMSAAVMRFKKKVA